ncbi:MAG: hypothetical protein PHF00_13025, partial [Elusimicrobia bacterium]|nr:hypothetical protein [Elusimicrobiota bacterium]
IPRRNNVVLDQAYFKIDKVFGLIDTTVGRMFFGEPGDLIAYFGPKYDEYGFNVTAIDGGRFDWTGEKAYATAVMFEPDANANAGGVDPMTGARVDVRGFIVGNKGHENIEAKVYVWNMMRHGDSVSSNFGAENKNSNLYVPGLKVKAKFGGVYGSVEYAQNLGEDRTVVGGATNFKGRAVLVDGGMKADVEGIGNFNPWAQFGLGTGRANFAGYGANETFQAIATDYHPGAIYGRFNANNPTGINFGGTMGTAGNGLQNRVIWGLGVKATPSALNKLTAGVAYYDFRFHRLPYGAGQDLGRADGMARSAGNRHIGSELDVTAEWKHSENVSLKGTFGNFQPGGYIKNIVNQNRLGNHPSAAMLGAFDVSVKF